MDRRKELNAFVKECITTALLQLMEKKPLENITVSELVEKAGVSRVSFYRNFESKQDILEKHIDSLLREWAQTSGDISDPGAFWHTLSRHFYAHRDFYLLLYRCGIPWMVYEAMRRAAKMTEWQSRDERYSKAAFVGMLFGIVDEWLRTGMQEPPEELESKGPANNAGK